MPAPPSGTVPLFLTGYHGTDLAKVPSILESNFRIQPGFELWFGNGVYFYAEGINEDEGPEVHAKKWAEEAPRKKCVKRYTHWAVLQVPIVSLKPLDVTIDEGKKQVNRTRFLVRRAVFERRLPIKKNENEDTKIIKFLIELMRFDVLITDCHDRMPFEIEYNVRTRFPTVRMIVVFEPHSCIDKSRIVVLNSGAVPIPP
jgi:hypothetical protein